MQNQPANCNKMAVKENNLNTNSNVHDRDIQKFWRYFLHLIFVELLFFTFQMLEALQKIFPCWYQLSQTNFVRKMLLKTVKFHKIWEN